MGMVPSSQLKSWPCWPSFSQASQADCSHPECPVLPMWSNDLSVFCILNTTWSALSCITTATKAWWGAEELCQAKDTRNSMSARRLCLSQDCPRRTMSPVSGCSSPRISQRRMLHPWMPCGVNGGIAEEGYRINYWMQGKENFRTV